MVLLWFGAGWVKKGVRRQVENKRAGWITDDPLEAEGIDLDAQPQQFSPLNFMVMTKSAALEAFEVAVIVVTIGLASQAWTEALGATLAALLSSIVLVALLHRYLRRVPDVLIKLATGILLCTLGTFWLGEGLGFEWWLGEWAILAIALVYSLLVTLTIYWLKRTNDHPNLQSKQL
ncbi:MAG: hypothetical protein AAFY26_18250 [Cyanobacteria bacterium J06638_22]